MTRLTALLCLAACGGREKTAVVKDSLTTRERQEATARSGIPGATGITRALQVADTAAARIQALDSIVP